MGDLISREAAIGALREAENHAFNSYYQGLKKAHKIIADLPPVKPQEPTGHWIEKMDACECPYCHKAWDYCDNDTEDFDYCPKCGAKLSEIPTGSESEG